MGVVGTCTRRAIARGYRAPSGFETIGEQRTVRETGERVMERLILERPLSLITFRRAQGQARPGLAKGTCQADDLSQSVGRQWGAGITPGESLDSLRRGSLEAC